MGNDYTIAPCPTYYRGVRMRSRNEAHYAAWLDTWCTWRYEPVCFADGINQWRIDFRIDDVTTTWGTTPRTVFVEVKPGHWLDEVDEVKVRTLLARMSAAFTTDPNAVCILEQSGAPGEPRIVRMGAEGRPTAHPGAWLRGAAGRPVLGLAEEVEWGVWDGKAA